MKVVFRADSSLQIGTGHVMRCRALAETLRRRGANVSFICRGHEGHLGAVLTREGFPVRLLEAPQLARTAARDLYASWLGVEEMQDARDTLGGLEGGVDALVVDHYGLSAAWETEVHRSCVKLVAIDDLGRSHKSDVLLDQNYARAPDERYAGLLNERCTRLLGPHYALLRREYAQIAAAPKSPEGPVQRILISFGGVDRENVTGRALDALSDTEFAHIDLDVVVGATNPNFDAVRRAADARPRTVLHRGLPSLAGLLSQSDLAFGAPGGTTWERCALGLPSIVISTALNQAPGGHELGAAGIIEYLGPHENVGVEAIRNAARALIRDVARRQSMADQSRLLVDGRGAERVAEVIMPSTADDLALRSAAPGDCAFLFRLANDPDVRWQSFTREAITWSGHKRWYEGKLQDSRTRFYLLDVRGLSVGQIRFDLHEGTARIGYSLDLLARGRGWGTRLVELGLRRLAVEAPSDVLADVRYDNPASRAVFDKLGFNQEKLEDRTRHVLSRDALVARFGGKASGGPPSSIPS